jgi:hypothetical protein
LFSVEFQNLLQPSCRYHLTDLTVLAFSLLLSPETIDKLSIFMRLVLQLAEAPQRLTSLTKLPQRAEKPQWAVAPIVAHHWMTASLAENWCYTVFPRALTGLPRALTFLEPMWTQLERTMQNCSIS